MRGDAKILADIARQGRVMLVDGDAKEIIPGITVYTGGKHTFASQFAGVNTTSGTVVIASDNMYLYENLARHAPIAQTLDAESNLRAQARMVSWRPISDSSFRGTIPKSSRAFRRPAMAWREFAERTRQ